GDEECSGQESHPLILAEHETRKTRNREPWSRFRAAVVAYFLLRRLRRGRDDALQTHVRDEIAVVLVLVLHVEKEDRDARLLDAEQRRHFVRLLVVHPGEDRITVSDRIVQSLREV